MIREMVREVVKEAIREAFSSGFSMTDPGKAAAKGKGGQARDNGPSQGGKSKSKGKEVKAQGAADSGRGKPAADPKTQPKPGKGKGAAPRSEKSKPGVDDDGNKWKLVERKNATSEFVLRQQDWDARLMLFNEVSDNIDKMKPDEIFKAVVRCDANQRAVLRRILEGSKRQFSVLAVTIGKEEGQTQERVPGRQGDSLAFRIATVTKLLSDKQIAPQPAGMKQTTVKLVQKATEVLIVRVSKHFATKELWEAFEKSPQCCVAQWLADRHVNALDSFAWKAEKGDNQGHQLFGLVRLLKPEAEAILSTSGQDGVFLDPSRSMQIKGKVEWVERSHKQESHSDYHARAIKCAGDLGLVVKGNRLATRSVLKETDKVPRIWIFEHVPLSVDPEQAKAILETSFVDVTMMRVRSSRDERTHPTDSNIDIVPINLDTGNGVITAWARVAPPRSEKLKQRQLPTTSLPLELKKTFRAAAPIAVPTEAQQGGSGDADMAQKGSEGQASADAK
ncbi:unnamed protein product [Symbiodinium pilosum]|uniref:Uncharacterized protein n=1 Tax=Symbiodinium pilosum TaxID=2952 RepID=A0A812XSA9_SYMPI|nr:unnamed protein product [Symbiodinium pilosum]